MKILNDLLTATREGRLEWGQGEYGKRPKYHGCYKEGDDRMRFNGVIVWAAAPAWSTGFGPHIWIGSEDEIIWTSRFSKAGQIITEIYNTAAKQAAGHEATRSSGSLDL